MNYYRYLEALDNLGPESRPDCGTYAGGSQTCECGSLFPPGSTAICPRQL